MVRGWGCIPQGLTMAREDSVKCLRCLLYALNLLFWVSAAGWAGTGAGAVPEAQGGHGRGLSALGQGREVPAQCSWPHAKGAHSTGGKNAFGN